MKTHSLPGLSNVGFWNSRRQQDWGVDHHRNEGLEILFLETGSAGFGGDGRHYPLEPGSLTITRPWQLHRLGDPNIGRGKLHWLILDVGVRRPNQEWKWPSWVVLAPQDLADLTRNLRYGETVVWRSVGRVREAFREIGLCVARWDSPRSVSRLTVAPPNTKSIPEPQLTASGKPRQIKNDHLEPRRTYGITIRSIQGSKIRAVLATSCSVTSVIPAMIPASRQAHRMNANIPL